MAINYFVTLKDHKEKFMDHPASRLINPSKNQMGRISKQILDQINAELVSNLSVKEWKNTVSVIKWFKNINNKRLYKFLQFLIKTFHASIKKTMLNEPIHFAKEHVFILYNDGEPWVKKESSSFYVTMSAYNWT